MVENLDVDGHPDKPQRINLPVNKIMSSELCDFVTNNTYFFFDTILKEEITGISKHFLTTDPATWEEDEQYIAAKAMIKKLVVVNDLAERLIALMTRFNTVLTHQEQQKQYILQTMEHHYNQLSIQSYSKTKFIEYLDNNYNKIQSKN